MADLELASEEGGPRSVVAVCLVLAAALGLLAAPPITAMLVLLGVVS